MSHFRSLERMYASDAELRVADKTVARGTGTFMRSAVKLDGTKGYA